MSLLVGAFALDRQAEAQLSSPGFADLVVARDDVPDLLGNDCNVRSLEELLDRCSGGPTSAEQTVLVLGDSHAEMWTPTLDELSHELGFEYVLHILGGCNVVGAQPPIAVGDCRRVQAQNLEIVDELEPDAVIVSHFADNVETTDRQEWIGGLETFLSEMEQRSIPVGWIHDSPSFEENPVECVSLRSEAECTESVEEATARSVRLREREAPTLERFDAVTVDPTTFMCDDEVCPLRSNGVFHYRDQHHVAATHARALAPQFRPLVVEVLGRAQG